MHHYIWNRLGTCTKVSPDHIRSEEGLLLYGTRLTCCWPSEGWVSNAGIFSEIFMWLLERARTAPFHLSYGVKILFAPYSMSWSSSLYTAWMVYDRFTEFPGKTRTACMRAFPQVFSSIKSKTTICLASRQGEATFIQLCPSTWHKMQVYFLFSGLYKENIKWISLFFSVTGKFSV